MAEQFSSFELTKTPRGENSATDALAALASTSDPSDKRDISVEDIDEPSISIPFKAQSVHQVEETEPETDWHVPIRDYITNRATPKDRWQARKLKAQNARFCIISEELYKRCIYGPYLRGRSLALRIKRQGYFWPTMLADCDEHAKKCDPSQRHAPMINQPAEPMSSVSAPYPFMRWPMDAIRPLEQSGKRRVTNLLVVTDYFTKWIEAESYQSIKRENVKDFLWKNVICRHGIPYETVTDNGTNVVKRAGEAANKLILHSLKRRLAAAKSGWDAQLLGVLWAIRTTHRGSTGETAFSLAYGIKAVVPAEISVGSIRRVFSLKNEEVNSEALRDNLAIINEKREQAYVRVQNYQNTISRFYNSKKIRPRHFILGDQVLRKVFDHRKEKNAGKMGTKWEGPFRIIEDVRNGVYRLEDESNGKAELRPWNVMNLKKYF
ncbi:PREDICTED: uncharacterized protein LOC109132831 [Camelina sativa]|uniref:Uncharacterized protein LOC109132831 n=1 Tax=Camelina sativa TaxID=90675 RepID=A0ABM1RP61_CAMSA|nr:PREDICTED: uncharacterized protein LOC109132831 [Camelina sativa]